MICQVETVRKGKRARLCGWWSSERAMLRELEQQGYRVVAWTRKGAGA